MDYKKAQTRYMFQFTHPGRGATGVLTTDTSPIYEFQFTHPGRGATPDWQDLLKEACVSIHAPREGCDFTSCLPGP